MPVLTSPFEGADPSVEARYRSKVITLADALIQILHPEFRAEENRLNIR